MGGQPAHVQRACRQSACGTDFRVRVAERAARTERPAAGVDSFEESELMQAAVPDSRQGDGQPRRRGDDQPRRRVLHPE